MSGWRHWTAFALAFLCLLGMAAGYWDVREDGRLAVAWHLGRPLPRGASSLFGVVSGLIVPLLGAAVWGVRRWGARPLVLAGAASPCAIGWLRVLGPIGEPDQWLRPETWQHLLLLALSTSLGLLVCELVRARDLSRDLQLAAPAAGPPAPRRDRVLIGVAVASVVYALVFFTLSCLRFLAYKCGMLDLGMYDQLHWSMLHDVPFRTTVFELPWGDSLRRFDYNYNAEHFMPILALTSAFYAVWQSPMMLFLVQSLTIGAAAIPLHAFATRLTGSRAFAATLAAAWLLHPLVQQANLKDFHPDALVGVFLFTAAWAFEARRVVWFAVAVVGAMACKEDVALMIVAWGLFLGVARGAWGWGAATMAAGALYFFGIARPIITAASGMAELRHVDRFDLLIPEGVPMPDGIGGLIGVVVTHPGHVLGLLVDQMRLLAMMKVLVPLAALALLHPPSWLLVVPALGAHIFSSWWMQAQFELYHAAMVVPWVAIGAAHAAAMLAGRLPLAQVPGLSRRAAADSPPPSPSRRRVAGVVAALVVATLGSSYFHGAVPPGGGWDRSDYWRLDRADASDELVDRIPPHAAVSATSELGTRLTRRRAIFYFPDVPPEAEYIAFDAHALSYPLDAHGFYEAMVGLLLSDEWGVVWFAESGQFLLRRGAATTLNASTLELVKAGD